ncbi:MAG TPA: hypothetical protein VFA89_00140 [Terriglobales bacterium]|nr:hypothetical protein [Terriglobales bacterium]
MAYRGKGGLNLLMSDYYGLAVIVQLSLGFGMAGLLWPEKVKDCTVLWYPFIPSYRAVRTSSIAALALSMLVFVLFVQHVS